MTFQLSKTPFQDSIKALNLQEGNKYTIIYINDWGMVATLKIKLIDIKYKSYAQYEDAVQFVGVPYRKRSVCGFWFYERKNLLIYKGWVDYEKSALYDIQERDEYTIKKSKFLSCDNAALIAIKQSIKQQPIYTLIHNYYEEYQITDSMVKNIIKQYAEENNNQVHESLLNRFGLTPRHVKETFNNKYEVILY